MYKDHMGSRSESKLLLGLGHSECVEAGKTGMEPLHPSPGVTSLQLEMTLGGWGGPAAELTVAFPHLGEGS